jgi:DivIVA domain-containing protein
VASASCHDQGVGTAVVYLVALVAVATVFFVAVVVVFGRGEELAPIPPGSSPTRLPARDVEPVDVRELRFQQVVRGYKMSEVDWALERLAGELDRAHRELETLRHRLAGLEAGGPRQPRGQGGPVEQPMADPRDVTGDR